MPGGYLLTPHPSQDVRVSYPEWSCCHNPPTYLFEYQALQPYLHLSIESYLSH